MIVFCSSNFPSVFRARAEVMEIFLQFSVVLFKGRLFILATKYADLCKDLLKAGSCRICAGVAICSFLTGDGGRRTGPSR